MIGSNQVQTYGLPAISNIYDFPLGELERAAYQNGDTQLAELIGRLIDADDSANEERKIIEEEAEESKRDAHNAQDDLKALRVSVRNLIANLEFEFSQAKKCGNRQAIDAAIVALYAAVEGK